MVDEAGAGLTVACPRCGKPITIPQAEPSPLPPIVDEIPVFQTDSSSIPDKENWGHYDITPRQIAVLLFFNVPFDQDATRGDASDIITRLFSSPANKRLWEDAKTKEMAHFKGTSLYDYILRHSFDDVDNDAVEELDETSLDEALEGVSEAARETARHDEDVPMDRPQLGACLGCGAQIRWQPSLMRPLIQCSTCGQYYSQNCRDSHDAPEAHGDLFFWWLTIEKKPAPEPIDWDNPPWKAKRKKRPNSGRA